MTTNNLIDDKRLEILRHMLGINKPKEREPRPYRDYYCATRGDQIIWQMANDGLVERYAVDRYYDWYRTTEAGRDAALASHRKIRLPKSKRIYARYLGIADVHAGLTFREFLIGPDYADDRADA